MEKSNNSPSKTSVGSICLLDTDVIINWLAKEENEILNEQLWKIPHKIIELIEEGKIKGYSTLINLLEIRFVLRRKKEFSEHKIKEDINKLLKLLEIIIPDEVNLLRANSLQSENPLSPFDAILVAVGLSIDKGVLISRDKHLLKIASKSLPTLTPEEFLNELESIL